MKKLQVIIMLLVAMSMFAFSTKASAQVEAKVSHAFAIRDTGWRKILRLGTPVTIFAYKHKDDIYTFGIYSDDYAGIIDLKINPFDVEEKRLKKLPKAQGKDAQKEFMHYYIVASGTAHKNAFAGKYKVIANQNLYSDNVYEDIVSKNDTITIFGYKKISDSIGDKYYYALYNDKVAGVYNITWDKPLEVNIPLSYLPSTDDAQVKERIVKEKGNIYERKEEIKRRKLEAEATRKRMQDSLDVVKMQGMQHEDSLTLASMKRKYMHKTWYYCINELEYKRFEPIEVIDIKINRRSPESVQFPMTLRYKRTNEIAYHDNFLLSDDEWSFDYCFNNIPPEKEYPTVRHWRAVKNHEIVLGMNEQEVELVWGYPDDVNTTKGRWGVHEQWVYYSKFGGHTRYLYFDNGRLTAIQR